MTESLREIYDKKHSQTRCSVCQFPAGKIYNRRTGEIRISYFLKAPEGQYICNICVDSGRGIPIGKMTKKERKIMKKARKGWLGIQIGIQK